MYKAEYFATRGRLVLTHNAWNIYPWGVPYNEYALFILLCSKFNADIFNGYIDIQLQTNDLYSVFLFLIFVPKEFLTGVSIIGIYSIQLVLLLHKRRLDFFFI